MNDQKIKKTLKHHFDDFEVEPSDALFANINNNLEEIYVAENQSKTANRIKYVSLIILLLSVGLIAYNFFTNTNNTNIITEKTTTKENFTGNKKNITTRIVAAKSNTNIIEYSGSYSKLKSSTHFEPVLASNFNVKSNQNSILKSNAKNKSLLKTNEDLEENTYKFATSSDSKINENSNFKSNRITKSNNKTNLKTSKNSLNNLPTTARFTPKNKEIVELTAIDMNEATILSPLNLMHSKAKIKIHNSLINNNLIAKYNGKLPKKELPKINKTTPLAIELGLNPFYAFQKIEPTAAGLANIQNISKTKPSTKSRLGYAFKIGFVINWTRQSRLRLGLSYRDIFQKVGYEKATDIYDFQTINGNQTVLVRRGLPYSEEKRNQLIGLKADRQFFLQLSTPTRFYASLGAEYTKTIKGPTQMLFVNSTMGIDLPIKSKMRLQLEPSYSYAILGTTDANKFLNINPNHLGVKFGLLYEIR